MITATRARNTSPSRDDCGSTTRSPDRRSMRMRHSPTPASAHPHSTTLRAMLCRALVCAESKALLRTYVVGPRRRSIPWIWDGRAPPARRAVDAGLRPSPQFGPQKTFHFPRTRTSTTCGTAGSALRGGLAYVPAQLLPAGRRGPWLWVLAHRRSSDRDDFNVA
jgi:hypothetical protein